MVGVRGDRERCLAAGDMTVRGVCEGEDVDVVLADLLPVM